MQLNKADYTLYAFLMSTLLKSRFYSKMRLSSGIIAYIIKCFSPILGYKSNRRRGYKRVLVLLEFKRLKKKIRVENKKEGIK